MKMWMSLGNLIRLADAADVPLCGGAFTIAAELIGAFDVSAIHPGSVTNKLMVLLDGVGKRPTFGLPSNA